MAQAPLQVAVDEVLTARRRIDAIGEDVRVGVDALVSQVENLLGGQWSGTAATSFQGPWNDWVAGGRDILHALDATAALLGRAAAEYAAQEQGNTDAVHAVGPGVLNL